MTMEQDKEFDELARQKLAGREMPFQEADWLAAKALIDAKRRDRGAGRWWLALVLLLLSGAGAWFAIGGNSGTTHHTNAIQAEAQGNVESSHSPKVAAPAESPVQIGETQAAITSAGPAHEAGSTAPRTMGEASIELAHAEGSSSAVAAATAAPSVARASGPKQMANSAETSSGAPSVISAPRVVNAGGSARSFTAATEQPAGAANDAAPTIASVPMAPASPTGALLHDASERLDPLSLLEIRTSNFPVPLVADSALARPDLAGWPPLRPLRTPWELSVMGGLFTTQSRYSGGHSDSWASRVEPMPSAALGAELLRMGRNFGIGAGLHFGTYSERIRSEALDHRSLQLTPYWYLLPVDTVLLVITDTLPGQPPVYTGQSVGTTVHVLAQGTDTMEQVQHLRNVRDQVNRVSYWEVPLLLDAHLVQGRWSLGVRGGPTVGLLMGRRGALPDPAGDGYMDLRDQAFRQLVLGYGARAYIRYRLNAAWSVGVEPALRGQLMNSLSGTGLERRAAAKGMMLGVTYRLR